MRRSTPAVIAAALAVLALGAAPVALGPGTGQRRPGLPSRRPRAARRSTSSTGSSSPSAPSSSSPSRPRSSSSSSASAAALDPEGAEGPQIHGNTRLEIIWTAIRGHPRRHRGVVLARSSAVEATSGERANELVVEVQGHQFYWQRLSRRQIAIDRLVLPVDRPVKLELVSFDVNHSWRVPELTASATPSRPDERAPLHADEEGVYEGRCAELCGVCTP